MALSLIRLWPSSPYNPSCALVSADKLLLIKPKPRLKGALCARAWFHATVFHFGLQSTSRLDPQAACSCNTVSGDNMVVINVKKHPPVGQAVPQNITNPVPAKHPQDGVGRVIWVST